MTTSPRPAIADFLSVDQVMAEFGLKCSAVYALGRHIPVYKPPGFGLMLRRDDIIALVEKSIQEPVKPRSELDPKGASNKTGRKSRSRKGTPRASAGRKEVPGTGLTREELRASTRIRR